VNDATADYKPSARELQVIVRVAAGKTNAQIGAELYLSPNTIKSHLKRITDASGVHGRAKLTAWAIRRGLIA
jgi:two-component system nitrate/nitrite response regulator NarL